MPWNELTGTFENYPSSGSPSSGGSKSSSTPAPYDPNNRSSLNDTLGGKKISYADDKPVLDDSGKVVPNKWLRVLHFEDGTLKVYEYDVKEHPENASGTMTDYVPVGAVYKGDRIDAAAAEIYDRRAGQALTERSTTRGENAQLSQEAGNRAAQSGYVNTVDEQGNIVQSQTPTVAREQLDISRAQLDRQTAAQEASTAIQQEQNQIARDRMVAEKIYQDKQLEAQKERDRINGLVSIGQLEASQAKNQFDQWLETNVKAPFMAMEEARSKATEQRQAQALEDARRQNAAIHTQNNEKIALDTGNKAMDAAISTLPYMAGPKWGEQFAGALNAIGSGRPQDIKFDAQGLTFDSPDFNAIAEQATARALSHLSPYAAAIAQAGDRPGGGYTTGDYSGITPPSTVRAPLPSANPQGTIDQIRYQMGVGAPSPPQPVTSGMQTEEWR